MDILLLWTHSSLIFVLYCYNSDDTIEVGASLYEIDTEAEGTVPAAPSAETKDVAAEAAKAPETKSPAAQPSETTVAAASPSHSRTPSIHFLGKDGWKKRLTGIEESSPAPSGSPSSHTKVVTVKGEIHPMYGRPLFTEKEMEALILGGAETAPSVVSKSGGAQFAA